ncbi:hypothetical protein BDV3_001879 [Batrachochytrium dendrobatidis]
MNFIYNYTRLVCQLISFDVAKQRMIIALLATAASVVSADFPQYNLIKADRDAGRFTFLPTTRAQKEVILKNAENILTAWVNYDSKMTNYGPAADPFKSRKHYNHKYTVDVPYVTGHSNACWALSSNMYKNLTNTTLPDTPAPPKSTSLRASKSGATTQSRMFEVIKDLKHPRARAHQDLEEKKMHQAIIGAESPKVTFTPTGVTKVSWAIYKPQTKNMGVIKLDDFEPTDPITDAESIDPAIRIIRSLLSKELKDTNPDSLVIHAEVSGIEKLTFSSTDGKTLYKNQDVPATAKTIDVDIFAGSSAHADLGNRAVRIIGTTKGKQVLKTNRFVRLLPSSSQRYDITTGPAFEFTSFTKNVGLYNTDQTSTANGWNKGKNGKFIIGNGIRYVENVDSAIDVFFTATAGEKLVVKLDVNLDSEPDFDFLYLDVKGSDGKVTPLLSSKSSDQKTVFPGVSGNNVTVTGSFPFTAPSKEFSIALRFTSDGGVDFSGATINQFRVERA